MGGNEGYQGMPSTLIPNTFNSSMAGDTCDSVSPAAFIAANPRVAGQITLTLGGTKTTGNTITLTIANGAFPGGSVTAAYTALSGDTLDSMAEGLAAAITSNATLQQYDVYATSSLGVVTYNQLGPVSQFTTITVALSGGATCSVQLSASSNAVVTVGGSATADDVVVLRFTNAGFAGGHEDVSFTLGMSDTLSTTAAGLAAAVNADVTLAAAGITATYASGATFTVLQSGPLYATMSQPSGSGDTELESIQSHSGPVLGGSGAAVPLQYMPVQINNSVIQLRYFIPLLLPYVTLKQLCSQGTAIK